MAVGYHHTFLQGDETNLVRIRIRLWCLVTLTWVLSPFQPGRYWCIPLVRTVLASFATSTFISSTVFGLLASSEFHGEDPTKWRPEDGGWEFHIVR